VKEKVLFCWSGGKDSALALYRLMQDPSYEVVALLTTYNDEFQRVSMHGVSLELSEEQARSIGLPLDKVFVSRSSGNDEYQRKMSERMLFYKAQGVTTVAFGDIFLEDLRAWREDNLAQIGMRAIFPLWKNDTRALVHEFVGLGFASRICCVNDGYLDESALGRDVDLAFIESLPADVDPCGENGEFHSFAYAGPIFKEPVAIQTGKCVYRPIEQTHPGASNDICALPNGRVTKGFWFCELLSAAPETAATT
jgi:uncharacterized protein (TIGR00290 family)